MLNGCGKPWRGEYSKMREDDRHCIEIPNARDHSSPPVAATTAKPSNPKDAIGIMKVPFSCVPVPVLAEVALGMYEGARKYGRHNYRVIGVRGSVYYDATLRHVTAWWEGEDLDPDSGINHISKAIASLVVLRDAMMQNKFVDDRPPCTGGSWQESINSQVKVLAERRPNAVEAYTEANKNTVR